MAASHHQPSSAKKNPIVLSKAVTEFSQGDGLAALDAPAPVFESFDAAFEQVFHIAHIRRIVFVIDGTLIWRKTSREQTEIDSVNLCDEGEVLEVRVHRSVPRPGERARRDVDEFERDDGKLVI